MHIKRFVARDMKHAIRLVRDEQGPDAVILSNQKVEEGIEIIAAVDYDPRLIDHALEAAGVDESSDAASDGEAVAAPGAGAHTRATNGKMATAKDISALENDALLNSLKERAHSTEDARTDSRPRRTDEQAVEARSAASEDAGARRRARNSNASPSTRRKGKRRKATAPHPHTRSNPRKAPKTRSTASASRSPLEEMAQEPTPAATSPARPNLSLWREGPEATVELSLILEDDPPRNDVVDWEPTPDVATRREADMVTLDAYDADAPYDETDWPTTVPKGHFTAPPEAGPAPRANAPSLRPKPRHITRQRYADIEDYPDPVAETDEALAEERVELSAAAMSEADGNVNGKPSFLSVLAGVARRGEHQRKRPQHDLGEISPTSARERATKLYVRSLTRVGVSQPLVHELATAATANGAEQLDWPALAGQANARLRTLDQEIVDRGGVVALVGPTGVGKTTSIAKLAARFALKHGRDRLALITTDTFRVGAHEQLNTFARILGVPLFQADDPKTFSSLMRRLSRHRLVLIDTAGMGQRDLRLAEELSLLSRSRANVQVLLTLSANTERRTMLDTIDRFAEVKPAACVLTKMDETRATGTALSALIETGLPLAYTSNGQNVPEDLHWARSKRLSLVQQVFHQADLECRDEFDDTDDEVRESA